MAMWDLFLSGSIVGPFDPFDPDPPEQPHRQQRTKKKKRGVKKRQRAKSCARKKMGWKTEHDTTTCSPVYRDAIRVNADRHLRRLFTVRSSALRYASPQGVAFVASRIPLPMPKNKLKEKDQLFEPVRARDFHWEYPWLKDFELVERWKDERAYILNDTWLMTMEDGDDKQDRKTRSTWGCRRRNDLETAMKVSLYNAMQNNTKPNPLTPFEDTFPGKLSSFLEHISTWFCFVDTPFTIREETCTKRGPSTAREEWKYFIDETHLKQLHKEIKWLVTFRKDMNDELKHRREAQELDKNRWGHQIRNGGRVSLMKTSGLGSPLREAWDSNYNEFSYDSWESWDSAVKPNRVVLVPQQEIHNPKFWNNTGRHESRRSSQEDSRVRW